MGYDGPLDYQGSLVSLVDLSIASLHFRILDQRLADYGVLLDCSHAHLFMHCL